MYPSLWQILIVLLILVLLFGHKRIRELGKSLGEGLRDFKKGLEGESEQAKRQADPSSSASTNASEEPQTQNPAPSSSSSEAAQKQETNIGKKALESKPVDKNDSQ